MLEAWLTYWIGPGWPYWIVAAGVVGWVVTMVRAIESDNKQRQVYRETKLILENQYPHTKETQPHA